VCTLVLAWQVFDDSPVVVAANRDEALGRPSEPPSVYQSTPRTIAPRDSEAGGTWIGYNEHGLCIGITNRWVDLDGQRSRGQLVADCLTRSSAAAAIDHVREATAVGDYAGFNLVIADREQAALLEWDGELRVTDFDPGIHVVVNVGADGGFFEPPARPAVGRQQAANAAAVREALQRVSEESRDAWLDRAKAVLGDHEFGVCVHGDGFGTRSASLIVLTETDDGYADQYWFADGPPCRTAFRRVESSL